MPETRSGSLGGRLVEIRKAGSRTFWRMQEATAEGEGFDKAGSYEVLAACAFWADTGEKVFAGWRDVDALLLEDAYDLVALTAAALELNHMVRNAPRTNGAAAPEGIETAAPSP